MYIWDVIFVLNNEQLTFLFLIFRSICNRPDPIPSPVKG